MHFDEFLTLFGRACFFFFVRRSLFEELQVVWIFVTLNFIHITYEWLAYVVRATDWYYGLSSRLIQWMPCLNNRIRRLLMRPDIPRPLWPAFIALGYSVRAFAVFTTFAIYCFGYLILTYSYNHAAYSSFQDPGTSLLLAGISVVVELVNLIVMEALFFVPRSCSLILRIGNLFGDRNMFWFAALVCTCICAGIFYPRVQLLPQSS